MLYGRTLSHSVLLRGLFRIIENIRPAHSCQFCPFVGSRLRQVIGNRSGNAIKWPLLAADSRDTRLLVFDAKLSSPVSNPVRLDVKNSEDV
jgi:hypothetical protein